MTKYIYVGGTKSMVKLEKDQPKVRVTPGQEVESDLSLPKHLFKMPGEVGKEKKASAETVLTKAQMIEKIKEIKFVGDLSDEQKKELKEITALKVDDLRVVYEKIIAEAPKADDSQD